jgi:serine/threonine-protein kinase
MATTQAHASSLDDGDEIDLYPTVGPETAASANDPSLRMDLRKGPAVTIGTETETLLRSRLRASAIAFLVAYLVLSVYVMVGGVRGVTVVAVSMALRAVLAAAVVGLLSSRVQLSLTALRWVEIGLFGGTVLLMMFGQYFGNLALMERNDLVYIVAFEKNGVLQLVLIMMIYGVLIPNDPKRTARVVLTLLLGPLVVLVFELEYHATEKLRMELDSTALAVNHALYLMMGAGLSIYIAYILHRVRNELREAKKLGQYQLGERLGSGGMGDVFLAEHQLLKRPCALKTINATNSTNPIAQMRFEREVQSAAKLTHPNTIAIFDYGHSSDGTFYYVMEYLPGMSVGELVDQFGPLPPGRAVYLMRQACGGLAEAHQLGLVHRDLKPANIFVAILGGQCDVAKVLDFGLVKLSEGPSDTQLTADQTVSGTPAFMAPEQARGNRELDARADIYALGGVLYFMLTGRPPFEGATAVDLMIAHARDPVVPPSKLRPEIPADLEAVVLKALAKEAEQRYPDARAFSRALGACACAADWNADRAEAWWLEQAQNVNQGQGQAAAPVAAAPSV